MCLCGMILCEKKKFPRGEAGGFNSNALRTLLRCISNFFVMFLQLVSPLSLLESMNLSSQLSCLNFTLILLPFTKEPFQDLLPRVDLHILLKSPAEGACAEGGIEPLVCQELFGRASSVRSQFPCSPCASGDPVDAISMIWRMCRARGCGKTIGVVNAV